MPYTPTDEELVEVLYDHNPWWTTGIVPKSWAKPIERPLAQVMWRRLMNNDPRRFQLILGPRRVGKTTVMWQTVRHLIEQGINPRRLFWLKLDTPTFIHCDLARLTSLAARLAGADDATPVFIFMDELNYAENWDLWLKTFHDQHDPVRILATASSSGALAAKRPDSGIGRWDEQHLAPYLFSEFLRLKGYSFPPVRASRLSEAIDNLIESPDIRPEWGRLLDRFLLIGGFPELLDRTTDDLENSLLISQDVLRKDAIERAIYKDIPQVTGISEPMKLERLLYILANQMTGLVRPKALANSAGLSVPTLESYMRHLQRSYLIFTLPVFAPAEETIQRRGRKTFFIDGAVRNAALQRGLRPIHDASEMGALYENAGAAHLLALSRQNGGRLFYWRDAKHFEVDLVFDHPDESLAFEISASANHATNGLRRLIETHPRFAKRGFLVSRASQVIDRNPNEIGVRRIPLTLFLLAVGLCAEESLDRRMRCTEEQKK